MKGRGGHAVIGGMGLAIAVLSVLLVSVYGQVQSNRATVRRLAGAVAAAQQAERQEQRLVRALQRQFRFCRDHPHKAKCREPLTQAPPPRTPPQTPPPATGSPASATPTPAPSRTPRPTRTPSPRPTSASPSPSPTCFVSVSRVCVSVRSPVPLTERPGREPAHRPAEVPLPPLHSWAVPPMPVAAAVLLVCLLLVAAG